MRRKDGRDKEGSSVWANDMWSHTVLWLSTLYQ